MKNTFKIVSLLIGILLISMFGSIFTSAISNTKSNSQDMGCTIFTASYGDKVLFGSNEDWNVTDYYCVVVPPSERKYGYIYFTYWGVEPFSGINEKGLCFAANGLSEVSLNHNPHLNLSTPPELKFALATCATLAEAIELANKSYIGESMAGQIHAADATGDAAVMSVGADGKLAFTRKEKGDGYLVSTNFNLANPENRHPLSKYPCPRYETAVSMLEEIESEDGLTVAKCRSILDAVHLEGVFPTHTSMIYDLKNGTIYIYRFHQYDKVAVLNLEEEFAKGEHSDLIFNLQLVQEKPVIGTNEIIVIGVIIMAVIAGLVGFSKRKSRK